MVKQYAGQVLVQLALKGHGKVLPLLPRKLRQARQKKLKNLGFRKLKSG
jgi:hypothetical protein